MRRPACIDVPAFPLQILLRRRPEWEGHPVAVVAEDRPQGLVLWANEEARRLRVLPGQRYATSLGLAGDLRADVVPPGEIAAAIAGTAERLRRFTPSVEPLRDEPGVFRLDVGGLRLLHPDLRRWTAEVRADLAAAGLRASVVVAATEFGAYAVARAMAAGVAGTERPPPRPGGAGPLHGAAPSRVPGSGSGRAVPSGVPRGEVSNPVAGPSPAASRTTAVLDAAAERRLLAHVPLDRLGIDPAARDVLARLGIRTVAGLLTLPPDGLGDRFGPEVRRLRLLAAGERRDPILPEPAPEPVRAHVVLEYPEADGTRLLFLVKRLLDPLLLRTAERREALAGIELRLHLEDGGERTDVLRTAAPTLDAAQVLDLARLRLESLRLRSGAGELTLTALTVPATAAQLALFAEKPKRDLAAADRALARLRAEFGEDAVVRARLRDAHLPEASFVWEPLAHAQFPRTAFAPRPAAPGAAGVAQAPLVRRLLAKPLPLPPRPRHEPDGWMLRGFEHGNVVRLEGPYVVSGGWWAGEEVRREYHFAETAKGRVFWIFYDVRRRRWFLHGEVC